MWSRRRFLESLAATPVVGDLLGVQRSLKTAPHTSDATSGVGRGLETPPGPSGKTDRDYFKELGVRPFINAAGTYTAMTASLMLPEVMDAINYASKHYVMLDELHDRVGERIATLVRAEAAMVTCGAASALTLGTAGVLTGSDRQKISDLPNLASMKSEVIIQKAHRFGYDRALRNCGVHFVEVETREDLERAVNGQTALMLFYNNNNKEGRIQDQEFAELGRKHGIPTMNDAAADVPPLENLWKYTAMGFDLVAFSGGKGLRGPQSAGLLLGKKPVIAAARMNASPNGNAIGRGMKVNKEEMLGMLAAVEHFVSTDHAKEGLEYDRRAEEIRRGAAAVPGVKAEIFVPEVANHVPHVRVTWDATKPLKAAAVVKAMQDGEPSIAIRSEEESLVIGVWMMRSGEEKIVARRLRQELVKQA
jgi:L-seryl-tRNA(Ser) seleniumtransferase